MSELKPEHGTLQAYITGFMLSLIFTFIPYYLVVHGTNTGTKLLAIILGFGVLQMLVQLLFFLHMGRKPRPTWQIGFLIVTVGSVLIVIGGSLIITTNLHHNMTPTEQVLKLANDEGIYQVNGHKTGACEGQNPNHQITITSGTAVPAMTNTNKCDTLSFINRSGHTVAITFGTSSAPSPYAGESGYTILAGQSQTINLSQSGTYKFYDAKTPTTTGSFTVSQ
jgi:cytochrome o ubiquinol oxidase operon protein cyoD